MGVNCKMDPYFPKQMHVLARMILYLCSSIFRISFPDRGGVLYSTLSLFNSNAAQSDCSSGKRGMADDAISAN